MDCHSGPVSKVSGPPETTASLARGGPPLQARHQRRLQPPSGTLSPPTFVISDSALEQWLQSDIMETPMFSLSKGQRQQPSYSAASVGGAPASSAIAAASAETSAAEPATSGTVLSAASIRGAVDARESSAGAVLSDAAPEAAPEAAPSTDGIAAPAASTAREARAHASVAGSDGEICGQRGASTHPFDPGIVCPLEVHYPNGSWLQHGSSSRSSSRSSNDNTSDYDSW